MKKSFALLLAFLLLAISSAAQAEASLPAYMTGPDNPAHPGQAVAATVVTAHGNQYSINLRLDEIRFENFSLIAFFTYADTGRSTACGKRLLRLP